MRSRRLIGALVAVLAVALVLAVVALMPSTGSYRVTAHFTRTVGLYPGSDVRILGVKVGQVESVTPQGRTVRVVLDVDNQNKVPANAKAVVVAPSLVSDRYVQLLPAWTKGPAMADGSDIPIDRTAVPVELDRVYASMDDLSVALGPQGANSSGALTHLLQTGAANLGGEGTKINTTVHDLSQALGTLAGGSNDLFSTVSHLQAFTTTLAGNDTQVRQLNADLATVSAELSGDRQSLALALKNLAVALDEVSSFVKDNRQVLGDDVKALADVTTTIASQEQALAETLDNAPVALSNLQLGYNAASGTLDTRNNEAQTADPLAWLCSLVNGATTSGTLGNSGACQSLTTAVGPLLSQLQPLLGRLPLNVLGSNLPHGTVRGGNGDLAALLGGTR